VIFLAKNGDFSYEVQKEFDFIIEESGNNSINLRKISWNGRPYKLDLRKYSYKDGKESMLKGISISDEGANELTGVLVENGYGDTKRIIKALRTRENFTEEMLEPDYVFEDDNESEEFYDPKQLLALDVVEESA
jgi:hypothetical protein